MLLLKDCPNTHPAFQTIKSINEYKSSGGNFAWSHVLREGNQSGGR